MEGTCKYCGETKEYDNKYQFGGHVGNCYLNPKRNKVRESQRIEVKTYTFNCLKCGDEYKLDLMVTHFAKGKHSKYCNIKCANSRVFDTTKTRECNCADCGCEITIKNNASTKTSLCDGCKIIKSEILLIEESNKIYTCNDCNKIIESKNAKYCDVCRIEHQKQGGRVGGRKSAQSQSETRRSKNEIYFYELCDKHFNNVRSNEQIFNGWDADVIIDDIKIAILWNGKWHYEKITEKHSVKQVQNRDRIKIKEIENYGYVPYVIKDMGRHNKEFVNEQFNIFLKYVGNNLTF